MRALSTVACATLVAALASGCSLLQQAQQAMTPSIAVGECTDLPDVSTAETEVSDIPTVDCAGPHAWEAYAEKVFGVDEEFPGAAEVDEAATTFCMGEFEGFIGLPYEASRYEAFYLYPTEETWTLLNDRTITCLVGLSDGGVTGSLADAAE
ncbi:septum formation family protein [Propioniciclava soli]|uniref:Septum formation family protein n=1 Tax=Propioniciclava soli TaxID=2775081 RepID=A0ABZ3C3D8_9ACTN|nr:septum formation family protein [Propioniciclava soli]